MKMTLFSGFGYFLLVKMPFVLPEIWAHIGPRGSSRLEPNEAGPSLRGSFWSYVPPVKSAPRSKKIDSPYSPWNWFLGKVKKQQLYRMV